MPSVKYFCRNIYIIRIGIIEIKQPASIQTICSLALICTVASLNSIRLNCELRFFSINETVLLFVKNVELT